MGGCATKPKVLKGDDTDTTAAPAPPPAPAPEPVKEAASPPAFPAEPRDVVVVEEGEKKAEAGGDELGAVDDDQASKRQSLSNLFQENEGKEPTEIEKTPILETEKVPTEASEKPATTVEQFLEAEKFASPIERTSTSGTEFVDAPGSTETPGTAEKIKQIDTAAAPEPEPVPVPVPVPAPAPAPVPVPETENKGTPEKTEEAK